MSLEKRSPWIVLGIPYPSTKATARRAFARRSRVLRRTGSLPWVQEDLAWADAEIALAVESPETTVDYFRVPADPDSIDRPREGDLFVPDRKPLDRLTQPSDATALDQACAADAMTHLVRLVGSIQPSTTRSPYDTPRPRDPEGA